MKKSRRSIKRCKRGQNVLQNIMIILVFLSIFALFVPIGLVVLEQINDDVQQIDSVPSEFKSGFNNLESRYPLIWDGLFAFMVVLLFVGTFIFAFLSDSQPLMFGIFAIGLAMFVFVLPFLANTFEDVVSQDLIATANAQFTIIPFVMSNYVGVSVAILFMVGIAFFAKRVLI